LKVEVGLGAEPGSQFLWCGKPAPFLDLRHAHWLRNVMVPRESSPVESPWRKLPA